LEKTVFLAEKARQLAELKKSELAKRAYFKNAGIEIEKMQPVLGLHALLQGCRHSLQSSSRKKNIGLCCKTIEKIRKTIGEEWIIAELEKPDAIKRFETQNRKLKLETKSDEQKMLVKLGLQKSIFFRAYAKNKSGFNRLMDENVPWIGFKS
jgi:hypothetical protein